ncbi:hypothetical protein MMC19_006097 [Ptychographa xylographoides]|nr:hypothetical protein [Ptychographa xylographoides]
MAASGANVLRYSALGCGILYGFYHQRTLNNQAHLNDLTRKYKAEESLIAKAKAEYTKKTMPKDSKTAGGDVISDPNDPKFDLEAYLTMKMAEQAK